MPNNATIYLIEEIAIRADEQDNMVMELTMKDGEKRLRIAKDKAIKMAEAMQKMYLRNN
jgi:hypothetical protein